MSFDPVAGTITLQLEYLPLGDFTAGDLVTLMRGIGKATVTSAADT